MKRYGPLIAVTDALAIGDPGRHHLRLTTDAVIIRDGKSNGGVIPWTRVERVSLDVPTTRFRLPGLVSTAVLGAVTVLTADTLDIDPDDGSVELTVEGEVMTRPLSRHHVGGYWAPTVSGAHRLLDHLVRMPEQRALLEQPEALIDVAAKLARTRQDG